MDRYNFRNYQEYERAQIEANKRKLHRNWANEAEMKYLAEWISANRGQIHKGICHGARNGKEAVWLSKYTNAEILSADISPSIESFGGVVWDFQKVNPEWSSTFDVAYSNSLDHAFNLKEAISSILDSLNDTGVLIIQWTPCGHRDFYPNKVDCFAANLKEYKSICNNVGIIVDVLRTRSLRKNDNIIHYHIIVGKRAVNKSPKYLKMI